MLKRILSFLLLLICVQVYGQEENFLEGLKAFDAKEYTQSFTLLHPYAKEGNCMAQFIVGFCYQNGLAGSKNDSLARYWLETAAEQKQPLAMGPLAANYFRNDAYNNRQNLIKAYVWAMLGAEYDESQKYKSTRHVIKEYLQADEWQKATTVIEAYKNKWKNQPDCQ